MRKPSANRILFAVNSKKEDARRALSNVGLAVPEPRAFALAAGAPRMQSLEGAKMTPPCVTSCDQ
jgi:hypothetical protein